MRRESLLRFRCPPRRSNVRSAHQPGAGRYPRDRHLDPGGTVDRLRHGSTLRRRAAQTVDAPSRISADLLHERFEEDRASADIILRGADPATTQRYADTIAAVDGVHHVHVLGQRDVDGTPASLIQATWDDNGQTQDSQDLARTLRAVTPPEGVTAQVGGPSAATVDLIGSIGSHLPQMGVTVAVVMLVLLFIAFGSVVLPVKAIAVNILSLVACFGVVTWIFQDGHLAELLRFTPTGYLDATQPILMLGILFGLSMDYEVFLLSRVREAWDATGDNDTAIVTGVHQTGGIITSAAVLLSVVVAGFAASGIMMIKMIGVGILIAVLLDATIVRGLLVPATMKLLGGRLAWWAPGPLRRWWDRHGHREIAGPLPSVATPAPVTEQARTTLDRVRAEEPV